MTHWVKIVPGEHARGRAEQRFCKIPKGIDMYDTSVKWGVPYIDARGDRCIDVWIPYRGGEVYRGYPLAFKDTHLAVSKTAMHGRKAKRVDHLPFSVLGYKMIVDYLGLQVA